MNPTERLQMLIKEKGLQQKALAEFIDVSPSTLNNWLARKSELPASKIIPICEFIGISEYFLLTGTDNIPNALNNDESKLLMRYRSLDTDGQDLVRVTALNEQRRMEKEAPARAGTQTAEKKPDAEDEITKKYRQLDEKSQAAVLEKLQQEYDNHHKPIEIPYAAYGKGKQTLVTTQAEEDKLKARLKATKPPKDL